MGLKDNLVRHYTFDSSDIIGTTVIDRSGNGQNATIYNTVTSIIPAPRYSTGASFPDNTSYIVAANIPTSTTYTFSWWGKFTIVDGTMMWGFSNGNRLNLFMVGNTGIYWNTGDSYKNPFGTIKATPYADDIWHHFAVTSNGTTSKLYIDGEFKANATTNVPITGTTIVFNGWDTRTQYKFKGSLSDFRLYNTCITDDEIRYLSKEPLKFRKTGVISSPGEFIEGNTKSLGSTGTVTMADFIEY